MIEGKDDCAITYLKPGFKALCWDWWLERRWPVQQFVLTEYQWHDTVTIRGEDGKPKFIPNPEKQLLGKDGKPVSHALFLRDFNNQILTNLDDDPTYAAWVDGGFDISSDENYIYSPYSRRNTPIGLADGVCRYRLDGKPREWEEVFHFEMAGKLRASIQQISVNSNGHIFFTLPGAHAPNSGVWKYDAITKKVRQITHPPTNFKDRNPRVSPDGRLVAFGRPDKDSVNLFIAQERN